MPYVGNIPAESYAAFNVQHFTTSATTSYTLDHAVANELDIRLVINNVIQQPGAGKAYTASGTSLTLSSATAGSDTMYCVYTGKAVQTVNPPAGSVGTSQLADSSVTNVKLGSDINATKLTAGLVPTARLGSGTASSSTVPEPFNVMTGCVLSDTVTDRVTSVATFPATSVLLYVTVYAPRVLISTVSPPITASPV